MSKITQTAKKNTLLNTLRSQRLFTLPIFGFIFSPGLIATLLTTALLTLLIKLGYWQLERGEYKQHKIQQRSERIKHPETDITTLLKTVTNNDYNDYPVTASGFYQHDKTFLLDNRTHKGRPGFNIITPLDIGTHIILVDRGWVIQGQRRDTPLSYSKPSNSVTLQGVSHVPNPNFFVLKEDSYQQVTWPFIIQKLNLSKTALLFSKPIFPFIIRLNPDSNSGFVREWYNNPMTPEKHFGYAFQWFGLAFALTIIYVVTNTKKYAVKRTK